MEKMTAERLDNLTYIGGEIDADGEKYYLIEQAYIGGTNDDPHYTARAIKAAEVLSGADEFPVYSMYWVPLWLDEEEPFEGYYEDESNACDWDSPYDIRDNGEFMTVDELDEIIERELPSWARNKKKITLETVIRHLQDTTSMVPDYDGSVVYYLHTTKDGKLVNDIGKADKTFTAILDSAAYQGRDDDWREDVEVASNSYFLAVAKSLTDQANEYFS